MVKNQANPESKILSVDNCVENQVVISWSASRTPEEMPYFI
jgi:hypothetical protein